MASSTDPRIELMQRFCDEFTSGSKLGDMFTDDASFQTDSWGPPGDMTKAAEFLAYADVFISATPDMKWNVVANSYDAVRGVGTVITKFTATHTGEGVAGFPPPTGKSCSIDVALVFTFNDDGTKIASLSRIGNEPFLMGQMGWMAIPGK